MLLCVKLSTETVIVSLTTGGGGGIIGGSVVLQEYCATERKNKREKKVKLTLCGSLNFNELNENIL